MKKATCRYKLEDGKICAVTYWAQTTTAVGKAFDKDGNYLGCHAPSEPHTSLCYRHRPKPVRVQKVKVKRVKKIVLASEGEGGKKKKGKKKGNRGAAHP